MKKRLLLPLIALLIVCAIAILPPASPAAAQTTTTDPQEAAARSSDPEANLPYLFAVYTITWAAFFAYVYYLSQRQRNLRREVEELKAILAERTDLG